MKRSQAPKSRSLKDFPRYSEEKCTVIEGTITVFLNGESRELPPGATVAAAVSAAGGSPGGQGVAAAVGGEVVPRGQWDKTPLVEGDRVEVVRAVQGG
jgi:sulfur carrier protein